MMLEIDDLRPNPRTITRAVNLLRQGGVIIFPTDTVYSFGCDIRSKDAIERIYRIKNIDRKKPLSFIFADISSMSSYVHNMSDQAFKIMRKVFPGPYTIILNASKKVPAHVTTKQKTLGVRIPDCPAALELVRELGAPLLCSSVDTPEDEYLVDPLELPRNIDIDLLLYAGARREELSTMIDCTGADPVLLRQGKGGIDFIQGVIT
jgi:tRNA threonylcarbamoyl adenosine modification protein (Sua5/YciO/YrdC/YwlC family)